MDNKMRLLCLGDVAISEVIPSCREWPPPDGFKPDESNQILFNYELPSAGEVNPIARTSGPRLLSSPDAPPVLKQWAPGIATLANNHVLDASEGGLRRTWQMLSSLRLTPIGAAFSESESGEPFIWETKEGSLAILNWVFPETHPEWMRIPGPICWPGMERAGQTIDEAKRNADWVLAVLHWSDELFPYPRPEDRDIARFLVNRGVDVVIGQHPHVVRGMETIEDRPVFYSLGNFYFSNFPNPDGGWITREAPRNREGLGILLEFEKGTGIRWSVKSFWRTDGMTVSDRFGRAERRLASTSRPLQSYPIKEYVPWYVKKRIWFDRLGYRFHFRLWQTTFKDMISAGYRVMTEYSRKKSR